MPAVVAVAASISWVGAVRRAGRLRARAAGRYLSAACALWALSAFAWLVGATALAGFGRAGFVALAAVGLWLTGSDRRENPVGDGGGAGADPGPGRRVGRRRTWRLVLGCGVAAGFGVVLGWGAVAAAAGETWAGLVLPLAGVVLSGIAGVRG